MHFNQRIERKKDEENQYMPSSMKFSKYKYFASFDKRTVDILKNVCAVNKDENSFFKGFSFFATHQHWIFTHIKHLLVVMEWNLQVCLLVFLGSLDEFRGDVCIYMCVCAQIYAS